MEICHYQDRLRVTKHLNDARQTTTTGVVSDPYRIQVGPETYLTVKAQSKLFTPKNDMSFIMAVHTILNESDLASMDLQEGSQTNLSAGGSSGSSLSSAAPPLAGTSHSQIIVGGGGGGNISMGGPLMTSVVNGSLSQCLTPSMSSSINQMYDNQDQNYYDTFGDFEFPHSTLDPMEVGMGSWADSRPDSRTSVASNSTPRPPSVTGYSPAASQMCPSPLTPFQQGSVGQQSPSHNNNNFSGFKNSNQNLAANQDDQKPQLGVSVLQHDKLMAADGGGDKKPNQLKAQDSDRLRSLLTSKRPTSSSSESSGDNKNLILKGLLNDDDNGSAINRKCGLSGRPLGEGGNHRMLEQVSKSLFFQFKFQTSNIFELKIHFFSAQLLNEKSSDDDDHDGRNKNNSELLKHLNKGQSKERHSNQDIIQLLKIQGERKRPASNEGENSAAKRPNDSKSTLWEKNKMLASLLANPAKAPNVEPVIHPRIIPDIPTSTHAISSTTSQASPISSSGPGTPTNNNHLDKAPLNHRGAGLQMGPQLVRKPSETYLIPPSLTQQQQKQDLIRQQQAQQQAQQQQAAQQQQQQNQVQIQPQQQPHNNNLQQLPRLQPNFAGVDALGQFSSNLMLGGPMMVAQQSELDPELQQILNGLMSDYMPEAGSGQNSFEPNLDLLGEFFKFFFL